MTDSDRTSQNPKSQNPKSQDSKSQTSTPRSSTPQSSTPQSSTPQTSKSQWDCIRENIGVWHGAFEQFSPAGELKKTTPSVLTLEETEPNKTLALRLKRTPADEPEKLNELTFNYPGPAPYTYFFESGAFSQGSSQWSAFGQFVTEFSLKVGDRRVRFVIAYESTPSYKSAIKYVTLICETQTGGTQFMPDTLSAQQLMGTWKGSGEVLEAVTGDFKTTTSSQWQLEKGALEKGAEEKLSLCCQADMKEVLYSLELTALEETMQAVVDFAERDGLAYRLMLLPKSAYCLLPKEIQQGCAFRIEVGWVSEENRRSRFVRYYDNRGVWTHSALIGDARI